jgi:hypothetical protein
LYAWGGKIIIYMQQGHVSCRSRLGINHDTKPYLLPNAPGCL